MHDTIGTTIDSGVTVGYIMMGVGLLLLALGLGTGGPTLLAVVLVVGAGVLLPKRSSRRSGGDVDARVILTPMQRVVMHLSKSPSLQTSLTLQNLF